PTGDEERFDALDVPLGERSFDDGFALLEERTAFSIAGRGMRISVEPLVGYRYAQVFAPKSKDLVALEPMTAPTNALATGRGLRMVEPATEFRAAFRIGVDA